MQHQIKNRIDMERTLELPDFEKLYKDLANYIAEHQGEKGYIVTSNTDFQKDTIYGFAYDDYFYVTEIVILAVRSLNGEIDVVYDSLSEDVDEEYLEDEENWKTLWYSDIYRIPTTYNIAEVIHEYV